MKKLLPVLIVLIALLRPVTAQLPPVFGPEYDSTTQRDELTRVYISPQRIVWTSDPSGKQVRDPHVLLQAGNSQAEFTKKPACTLTSSGDHTAAILLDYGKELHGGLQLVLAGGRREPSLVRIRFGESVGECNSETSNAAWKVGYSTDDHAKRDIMMEIPRDGSIEIGNTGFRFVRIDLLQPEATIKIREARAILRYRDIPYHGSFHSSDERLNRIWMTGAYTVHLNMQEFLWDGIKRDRVIWLGDMHPELASIRAVFGYNDVVPNSLDLACRQFPLPGWMNGMPSYSLWYLIIQHDWYMQNGDLGFLNKHREYITGLIDQIDANIDAEGEEIKASDYFLDWPSSPNKQGVKAGFKALMVWAMKDAEMLCRFLEEPEHARKAASVAERLMRSADTDHNHLKQAAGLMAIAGMMDPVQACEQVISVDGAQRFSTFYGYYMLQVQAMGGHYQQALDVIRTYWGGMLDMGATTFWEDFNLEWLENAARLDELTPPGKKDIHGDFGAYCYPGYRHSFCHGWASGPTAWLSEHVLGVQVMEPGCKVIRINPHLGDLEWVEGTFPTPYGIIGIRHTKNSDGTVTSRIQAPKEITILSGEL